MSYLLIRIYFSCSGLLLSFSLIVVWSIYEQTFIAALDCGNNSLAEVCIKTLKRQFPDSLRVSILEGLCLEAKEK